MLETLNSFSPNGLALLMLLLPVWGEVYGRFRILGVEGGAAGRVVMGFLWLFF